MRSVISILLGLSMLWIPGSAWAVDSELGTIIRSYLVADPTAPVVTPENVLLSDAFWPFRIILKRDYEPPGAGTTILARPGVLVRVNPEGTARVDFASLGRFDVPIELTDLIESSNRVRLGAESKMAPNLVLSIGNKLIDSTRERVHVFHIPRDTSVEAILCVFADPNSAGFPDLAHALEAFVARSDLQTVIFPRTDLHDLGLWKRFRELGLRAPFVRDRYREPFFRSLLSEEDANPLPYVQLVTKDGRILEQGRFDRGVLARVAATLRSPDARSSTDRR